MSAHRYPSRRRLSTKVSFRAEAGRWASTIGAKPTQIRVQAMKRKWASCSTAGWVCFSDELLRKPRDVQEFVIVHEILHLQVPNHGKLFKSLLRAYLPHWEKAAARLNGRVL